MDDAQKKIFLHIGTHKTGSTSLQHFLSKNRRTLGRHGTTFYEGRIKPNNHVELHIAAMRPERMSPAKLTFGEPGGDAFAAETAGLVRRAVRDAQATCVFSAEGLSFLRYEDEVERLKGMLPGQTTVVVYLRNEADYLVSHRAQLAKSALTRAAMHDPESTFYTGPGTWLTDYRARLEPFRTVFGDRNVVTIDYDAEERAHGSIIPSFLDVIGLRHAFCEADWTGIRRNSRETRRRGLLPHPLSQMLGWR